MSSPTSHYRLRLELKDIAPPIWREVFVDSHLRLLDLHQVIQITMGWFDYHLHLFRLGETIFEPPDPDAGEQSPSGEAMQTPLSSLLQQVGDQLEYEYDFGDGWEVTIRLEEVRDSDGYGIIPYCTGGARNGPLEDSGGPLRYSEIFDILADPEHPEHEMLRDWMPPNFHPEEFDIRTINMELDDEFGDE